MSALTLPLPFVQHLDSSLFHPQSISADVLRLDAIHPLISGNKWYKLKGYLQQLSNDQPVITFGGAYSNHIHATAAVCQQYAIKAIGIIRGEQPAILSPTLQDAIAWGMELHFVSRGEYSEKSVPAALAEKYPTALVINEGGYGIPGMQGAQEIVAIDNLPSYTHILAAVGTGTTLAGLITAALPHQQVIGISVMKNNLSLEQEIKQLTGIDNSFSLLHQFAYGGYARYTSELIDFMNQWFRLTGIPTDFVYTAKLFSAFMQLVSQSYFPAGSRILIIHSGGLQGNRSLKKGTLIF